MVYSLHRHRLDSMARLGISSEPMAILDRIAGQEPLLMDDAITQKERPTWFPFCETFLV